MFVILMICSMLYVYRQIRNVCGDVVDIFFSSCVLAVSVLFCWMWFTSRDLILFKEVISIVSSIVVMTSSHQCLFGCERVHSVCLFILAFNRHWMSSVEMDFAKSICLECMNV